MLFRWSDGHSFAVKFQADRQTVSWRSTAALEKFQRARAKRYHDGATRRDMVWFPTAELHVGLDGRWWNPGRIRSAGGLAYFETTPFAARGAEIEAIDEVVTGRFEQQAFLLLVKSAELWERAEETARWLGALSDLADGVVEAVRRD